MSKYKNKEDVLKILMLFSGLWYKCNNMCMWGTDYKNDRIEPRSLGEIVRTSGHKKHFKEIMKIILEIWINVHSQ